ncbi:MAG: hypothetical protein CM15mP49_07360 [Actinomycetota bacterium]|nr:MAG: hypothetical protein CM15mP49_07360 [Actinomycetota bacterium]
MEIYAPTGNTGEPQNSLASPIPVLNGLSLGILDNTKPNARVLLDRLAERLVERVGLTLALAETKMLLLQPLIRFWSPFQRKCKLS